MKTWFKLVVVFLLSFSLCHKVMAKSVEDYVKEYDKQLVDMATKDPKRLEYMFEVYKRSKVYNLGYSAVAIAWQESNFGKWQINLADPSCGPFHQRIDLYLKKHNVKDTNFNRNKYCMAFIEDLDLATATVIAELEFWLTVHSKRYDKFEYVYRSYNAGYNYNSNVSKEYAKKIRARIRVLKKRKVFD